MEIEELKTMWQAHETKIGKSTSLNLHTLGLIQTQRVRSAIQPLLIKNILVLASHTITIIALLVFLGFNMTGLPYAASAIVLLGYYVLLFINTYKQITAIKRVNKYRDIVSMQSSLAKLKTHILDFIRLSVLTIPAFLSFPVVVPKFFADLNINIFNNFNIIEQTNGNWWIAQLLAFTILIPVGTWFYRQVTPQNIHKRWVRHIIHRTTNKSVGKAVQYLKEMEELKAEQLVTR